MQAPTAPPLYADLYMEKVEIDASHQHAAYQHAAAQTNASINVPIQMQPQPQPQLQTLNQFSGIPPSQIAVISRKQSIYHENIK